MILKKNKIYKLRDRATGVLHKRAFNGTGALRQYLTAQASAIKRGTSDILSFDLVEVVELEVVETEKSAIPTVEFMDY